jgi:hypothetical protein
MQAPPIRPVHAPPDDGIIHDIVWQAPFPVYAALVICLLLCMGSIVWYIEDLTSPNEEEKGP